MNAPETEEDLLDLLKQFNNAAGDVLTQLNQWDILLKTAHGY